MSSSRAHVIRYGITMGVIALQRFLLLIFLLMDIKNGSIEFDNKLDILQLTMTHISFYCCGNHLHTFWKGPEITATVNSFLLFYENFQSKESGSRVNGSVISEMGLGFC